MVEERMNHKRNFLVGATFVTTLVGLGIAQGIFEKASAQNKASMIQVPRFEVDPLFPKPLPNNWYQGQTIGLSVDASDHVWIVHRADSLSDSEQALDLKTAMCCAKAPPVLEFDQMGNLLNHWGGSDGPTHQWPASNHGIEIDKKGFIWMGGNGGGQDGHVIKFTKEGKVVMQIGVKKMGLTADSNSMDRFYQVARIFTDPNSNELYFADGYGNKRVAVVDSETGKILRYWGAYGNKPVDGPLTPPQYNPAGPLSQQFRGPVHCANISNDGIVYVCDRGNNRIQSFTKDGKYIKEVQLQPNTRGDGSTWDIAFSRDTAQKYMYVADGKNEKVWILERATMEPLSSFGSGGKQPGQFYAVHSIATDSKGNIYTTETYDGRRLQRFLYKGLQSVEKGKDQGTVWPKSTN
jgi:sugar lactone lactonase YvrE